MTERETIRNMLCSGCGRWHDHTGEMLLGWFNSRGEFWRLPEGHMPPQYAFDDSGGRAHWLLRDGWLFVTSDRADERQQAVEALAALYRQAKVMPQDSRDFAEAILDSGVVVPKAELDAALFDARRMDRVATVVAGQWREEARALAAAERAREEGERKYDELGGTATGTILDLRGEIRRLDKALAAAESERDELRKAGDLMQSSLARLIAWVTSQELPYEVRMAAMEGSSATDDWTAARAALARSQPTTGEGEDDGE